MISNRVTGWLAALGMAVSALPAYASYYEARESVYTMSNAVAGNEILKFRQRPDGKLAASARYATGGTGTGAGLGNQGALATDGDYLFVVNPGSDDLSVLRIHRHGLKLVDRIPSGGIRPVSVTVDRDLVYVLNAGSDNIAGFEQMHDGKLRVLPGSEHGLSGAGTDPAQIQFSADGRSLIVTEKATDMLVTFRLNHAGIPVRQFSTPSPGATPFGFATGHGKKIYVSEAVGGAPNASTVSSYRVKGNGKLQLIAASVATLQSAACWVVTTPDGRFAYTTNTGSGTVSGFRAFRDGRLSLLDASGVSANTGTGSAPIDMIFSEQGEYLHVLNSGTSTIATFRVDHRGNLEAVGDVGGLPATANGLVAF